MFAGPVRSAYSDSSGSNSPSIDRELRRVFEDPKLELLSPYLSLLDEFSPQGNECLDDSVAAAQSNAIEKLLVNLVEQRTSHGHVVGMTVDVSEPRLIKLHGGIVQTAALAIICDFTGTTCLFDGSRLHALKSGTAAIAVMSPLVIDQNGQTESIIVPLLSRKAFLEDISAADGQNHETDYRDIRFTASQLWQGIQLVCKSKVDIGHIGKQSQLPEDAQRNDTFRCIALPDCLRMDFNCYGMCGTGWANLNTHAGILMRKISFHL